MKIASITHCSALKAIPSQIAPNGMSGGQASIASDWLSKVEKVRPEVPAANLYTGRGYKTLLSRIGNVGGLYVVSAGLGLIPSDRAVPGYDLTIAVGYETRLMPSAMTSLTCLIGGSQFVQHDILSRASRPSVSALIIYWSALQLII